jgi:hypothetical protein
MALLLAVLLLLLGIGPSSGSGGSGSKPALHVASLTPVRVTGTAFRPRERVRVTVAARRRAAKTVRASSQGGFTVVFASLAADPCTSAYVIARGSAGSRATAKVGVRGCPPPLRSSG